MKEERRKALHIIAVIALALLMAIPVSMATASTNGVEASSIGHETGVTLYVNGYSVDSASMSGIPDDLLIDHYVF